MAINGRAISVSDPGAVPGASTITFFPDRGEFLSVRPIWAMTVGDGGETGSTVV
ncbi:MAG: hypothetical protein ACOY17_01190 [Pseudomonadota bacterium]